MFLRLPVYYQKDDCFCCSMISVEEARATCKGRQRQICVVTLLLVAIMILIILILTVGTVLHVESGPTQIILVGGWSESVRATYEVYHLKNQSLNRILAPKLLKSRWGHVSVILNGHVIVTAGGVASFGSGGRTPTDSTESLDLLTLKQETLSPLNERRRLPGGVAVGNTFYLCGGHDNDNYLTSCEKRQLDTEWTPFAPMHSARAYMAMVAIENKIYALGGYGEQDMDIVQMYDIGTDGWSDLAPLIKERHHYSAAVLSGLIFICGGNRGRELNSCEKYEPLSDTWTAVADMHNARYGLCMAEAGGYIYALGGGPGNKNVEKYNAVNDEWTEIRDLMFDRDTGYAVVV